MMPIKKGLFYMQNMSDSNLLTICIPTYNRCEFLDYGVRKLAPYAQQYGITIVIVDNDSPDDTEIIGRKLTNDFSNIKYYRNDSNIGPDRNFEKALKLADTKYAWLMSDDDGIVYERIPLILSILSKNNLDMLILNARGRVNDVASKLYTDHNELLSEIGWHMQYMSCLIFSNEIIERADFKKYWNTNLMQYGIIFDTLSKKKEIQVYFLADVVITGFDDVKLHRSSNDGWMNSALRIFVTQWTKMILSFPDCYTDYAKRKAIMEHGIKSKLFRLRPIISLSMHHYITPEKLTEVKEYYHYAISYPYWLVKLIACTTSNKFTLSIWEIIRKIHKLLAKRG